MPKTMGMNSSAASGMQTAIFSMMRRTVVLAAAPLTESVGPRLMWGISAGLLVVGFLNTVLLSAVRRSKDLREQPLPTPPLAPVEAGGETPGSALDRIATLLDEVEREREQKLQAEATLKRQRRSAR